MALAPLPTTATRLPVRSTEWSQRAECHDGPANVSNPSMPGMWGRFSWPQATTTVSASSSLSPSAERSAMRHLPVGSSKRTDPTVVPRRRCGRRWYRSTRSWAYVRISACSAYRLVQSVLGAKENE